MPAWRRRRFIKIRAKARKLGLLRGSPEWRKFLGLKEIVLKEAKPKRFTELRQLHTISSSVPLKVLAKPIAEPPSVKGGEITKEDRRPRPPGKRR
jgi:hypothetical protein